MDFCCEVVRPRAEMRHAFILQPQESTDGDRPLMQHRRRCGGIKSGHSVHEHHKTEIQGPAEASIAQLALCRIFSA